MYKKKEELMMFHLQTTGQYQYYGGSKLLVNYIKLCQELSQRNYTTTTLKLDDLFIYFFFCKQDPNRLMKNTYRENKKKLYGNIVNIHNFKINVKNYALFIGFDN